MPLAVPAIKYPLVMPQCLLETAKPAKPVQHSQDIGHLANNAYPGWGYRLYPPATLVYDCHLFTFLLKCGRGESTLEFRLLRRALLSSSTPAINETEEVCREVVLMSLLAPVRASAMVVSNLFTPAFRAGDR